MGAMDAQLVILMEEVIGTTDLAEFHAGLLRGLMRVVPSDAASLNDVGPEPGDVSVVRIPEGPPELFALFARLKDQNPIVAHFATRGDGRATRFSDLVGAEELRSLELYRRVYEPMGLHHQIAFTLPSGPRRILGVALSRGAPDYSDAERDLLNRARPILIQAFRAATEHDRLRRALADLTGVSDLIGPLQSAGLTAREAEVLRLAALGNTSKRIAAQLETSDKTVNKHLERCYRKLGVHSRAEAAARLWALAADGAEPTLWRASGAASP
jgi:DNA-binding CsgD family transcriptional regulator